eukprot:PhF_6_TR14198/c0_g1_i1/m.22742
MRRFCIFPKSSPIVYLSYSLSRYCTTRDHSQTVRMSQFKTAMEEKFNQRKILSEKLAVLPPPQEQIVLTYSGAHEEGPRRPRDTSSTKSSSEAHTTKPSATSIFLSAVATRQMQETRPKEPLRACVFGGAQAIQNAWHRHGIRPHAVFVADDVEVPSWCHHSTLPTYIVRAPVQTINKMVHAHHNDGFAAQFPAPLQPSPLELVDTSSSNQVKFQRILVLYGMSIPGNVGMLLRCARTCGFDAVVLTRSVHLLNEKVLRSSSAVMYDTGVKIFDLGDKSEGDTAVMLQQAALSHGCVPVFSVPNQKAQSLTTFCRRHYMHNKTNIKATGSPLGVMLFVGSEHHGLENMQNNWNSATPEYVTLNMDNPLVDSLNVVAAGSVMMHAMRKGVEVEHEACFKRGIQMDDSEEQGELLTNRLSS